MPKLFYAVTASIEDDATATEYLDWLTQGHVAQVLKGGAESALIVRLARFAHDQPVRLETQYVFPSREAFDAYEQGPAIELREDGRQRFADRGVSFERRVGEFTE